MVRPESQAYRWDIRRAWRPDQMFRSTLSYARYVLTSLSTVAFFGGAN